MVNPTYKTESVSYLQHKTESVFTFIMFITNCGEVPPLVFVTDSCLISRNITIYIIFLTKSTAMENEIALIYYRVRGLYFVQLFLRRL